MLDQAERAAIAGDLASADELLRSAARIQEAELGPLHPDLASTLNNLGIVAEKTGRPGDAEAFYRRAAAIASASLPSDHPIVADSRKTLEDFCRERGLPIDAAVATMPSAPDSDRPPSSGTPLSVARTPTPTAAQPLPPALHGTSRPLAWVAIGVVVPCDYRDLCEATLVAARNANADTDGSTHSAAGRRASAGASRHARSDRTGTIAQSRTAWQQWREPPTSDRQLRVQRGASAWPLPNCARPFRRAAATGDAIR